MSGDPAADYFSDGISEEILNVLAGTPDLQVAARTSSFAFKGQQKDVPVIARELRVRMVLEGSVRRQDQKVRITAQLIDAQTGFHLWSETYDRELKDIFAIQDEIARAIGDKLKVQVGGAGQGGAASGGTQSVEAHDHYLRGMALWQRRREAELFQAIQEFEIAIAADPTYAAAYGGLALVYSVIGDYSRSLGIRGGNTYGEQRRRNGARARSVAAGTVRRAGRRATVRETSGNHKALYQRAIAFAHRLRLRISGWARQRWRRGSGGGPHLAGACECPRSPIARHGRKPRLRAPRSDATPRPVLPARRSCVLAPDYFHVTGFASGSAELLRGRPAEARPFLVRAAELDNPSAVPLVRELVDALAGHGDRRATARRLAAFPVRSYLEPGSGNIFSDGETPALLMLLGAPDLALDYLERNSSQCVQFAGLGDSDPGDSTRSVATRASWRSRRNCRSRTARREDVRERRRPDAGRGDSGRLGRLC